VMNAQYFFACLILSLLQVFVTPSQSASQAPDWPSIRIRHDQVGYLFLDHERAGSPLASDRSSYRAIRDLFLIAAIPVAILAPGEQVDVSYFASGDRRVGGLVTMVLDSAPARFTPTESIALYGRLIDSATVAFRCKKFFDDGSTRDRVCHGQLDIASGNVAFESNTLFLDRVARLSGANSPECIVEVVLAENQNSECRFRPRPENWVCYIVSRLVAETRCSSRSNR
jgi:hypothetical protein